MKQIVRQIQLELFAIEVSISEFQAKRKELKTKLAKLGAGEKRCTKCKVKCDIEQFYRDVQKIDRRHSWCIECVTKAVRDRNARNKAA